MGVSLYGASGEIPPLPGQSSNPRREAGAGTAVGGRFDWGGRLPKSNGGARRSPRAGRKSAFECKGTRGPDCEADRPGRRESGS